MPSTVEWLQTQVVWGSESVLPGTGLRGHRSPGAQAELSKGSRSEAVLGSLGFILGPWEQGQDQI